jgi:uncharacterized membrane protein YhhN
LNLLIVCAAAAVVSALAAMGCEVIAERSGKRPSLFLLLKPLTTILITATLFASGHAPSWLLLSAFVFALIGDIALMFEGDKAFLAGLGSFFIAHIAFVAVFIGDAGLHAPPLWTMAFVVYAIALFAWLLPKTGPLAGPTVAYGVVLTAMVLASAAAQNQLDTSATRLTLAGAVLFAFSDSVLAIRQFVGPYRGAQPLILSSYWLAIGLIAASHWPS